ncbi:MAG: MliC family protein, partial [Rhodospirillaceae bacterium]|nr:MliC family protein [Rhodospirillaceae bacterium]
MKRISAIGWAAAMGLAACGNAPAPEAAPAAPLAFVTAYMCGETAAEIGMRGDETVLRVAGADHALAPAESASGAKYAAPGEEPETWFWSKGDRGLLTVAGTAYPECVKTGGEPRIEGLDGWTARGQEPGWRLTINGGKAEFTYNYGEQAYSALLPEPRAVEGGIAYS